MRASVGNINTITDAGEDSECGDQVVQCGMTSVEKRESSSGSDGGAGRVFSS